jgi:Zn-dependent protease with chaperone function
MVALAEDEAPPPVRVDVLAYPRPSTARFLSLLAAILGAGLFLGNWVHNEAVGDSWTRAVAACLDPAKAQPADLLERHEDFEQCTAGVEQRRAAFALGGAAAVGVAGLIVLVLAPGVIERRRRLRALDDRLPATSARIAALAREAGLAQPPGVALGPAGLRDAFSFGLPRHYRIALPKGLAVRPASPLFEAVVRHELAHIHHRDVALAWLARSVWYVLAPLLVLPVLVAVVTTDFSLLSDYLWRAALFAAIVLVLQAALLRSREHDADLAAARAAGGEEALAAAIGGIRKEAHTPLRRLLAKHPDPTARLMVLERPERAAAVTAIDGLTSAFLAAILLPTVVSMLTVLLTGTGQIKWAQICAAVLAGVLLGATVGIGLWRQALVGRVTVAPARVAPAAAGVFAGLLLGQLSSFAQVGTGTQLGTQHPLTAATVAVAGGGATVVAAGLGELWADVAGRARRRRIATVPAVLLVGVLFASVLWAALVLQEALDQVGWRLASAAAVTLLGTAPIWSAALILAIAAGWALWAGRPGGQGPAWLLERGTVPSWVSTAGPAGATVGLVGVAGGVAGGAVIVGFRLLAGPAGSPAATEQRYYAYLWIAAAAGATAAATLAVLYPRRGTGAGLVASCLAVLTAEAAFLALNTALGGSLTPRFVVDVVRPPLALAVLLQVLVAAVTLPSRRTRTRSTWPTGMAAVLAAALAFAAGTGILAGRDILVPFAGQATPDLPPGGQTADDAAAAAYLNQVAPTVIAAYDGIERTVLAIDSDQAATGPERATRIRNEILGPLTALLTAAEASPIGSTAVTQVHRHCLESLRTAVRAFTEFATAYETSDQQLFNQAKLDRMRSVQEWRAWRAGLATL